MLSILAKSYNMTGSLGAVGQWKHHITNPPINSDINDAFEAGRFFDAFNGNNLPRLGDDERADGTTMTSLLLLRLLPVLSTKRNANNASVKRDA